MWLSMDSAPKDRDILAFDQRGPCVAHWLVDHWQDRRAHRPVAPQFWQPIEDDPAERRYMKAEFTLVP